MQTVEAGLSTALDLARPTPPARHTLRGVLLGDPVGLACSALIALVVLAAVFAPLIAPNDPLAQSVLRANRPPSLEHWVGTDKFGRDILSRIVYGARTSLLLGLTAPLLAGVAGTLLGVAAGYFGGWTDRVIGRATDLFLAFPAVMLGIMVAAALGAGFAQLVVTLTVAFAPRFTRIARASSLSIRTEPYVEASMLAGLGHWRIILRHVIPNIVGPLIVVFTLEVASAIRLEATLSFIGLGTQPPDPSWGNIIRDGLNNLFGSAWPVIAAGAAITLTTLAIAVLGDRLRDALDPATRN